MPRWVNDCGHRIHKFHQFLTAETGYLHLVKQIAAVSVLMRASRDKAEFDELFERAYPPRQLELPVVDVEL
jgi:hypothetical protein